MSVTGIDVATFQGLVDWPAVKAAGYEFAIAKATEFHPQLGALVDKQFARNWKGIRDAGLEVRGAYCYIHPSIDPQKQVEHFHKVVGDLGPGDLSPALDFESHDGMKGDELVARFRASLEATEALFKRWPTLYTGKWFWDGWLKAAAKAFELRSWPVWIADYRNSPPNIMGWDKWTFWQHGVSPAGAVPGIKAKCDLDKFNGTMDELRILAGLGGGA